MSELELLDNMACYKMYQSKYMSELGLRGNMAIKVIIQGTLLYIANLYILLEEGVKHLHGSPCQS